MDRNLLMKSQSSGNFNIIGKMIVCIHCVYKTFLKATGSQEVRGWIPIGKMLKIHQNGIYYRQKSIFTPPVLFQYSFDVEKI